MYWETLSTAFEGYARYLANEVVHPHTHNYLYWLIGISVFVYGWELARPWRVQQARIRKDFWLDAFYMFFNFFLFNLIGFVAVAAVVSLAFCRLFGLSSLGDLAVIDLSALPVWAQLLSLFIVRDFIHWNVHRLLHRVSFLWTFHKVHHSVLEMGFAAHLRFHWMETVVYRALEVLPLALFGFGIDDFIIVYLLSLLIGHLNHANIVVPLGPLRYLFNNPQMHIWHHVRDLPKDRPYGLNYGISLSIWDYLFGSAYVPSSGRDIPLGFPQMAGFPKNFLGQAVYPLTERNRRRQ